jgi:excisionase family DNA binding protein
MIEIRGSLVEAGPRHGRDPQRVPPILLSLKDAARALAVSDRSLWEWTKAGKVPHIRLGRRVLYSPDDLRRWVEGQRQGPDVATEGGRDAAPRTSGNGA